MLWGGRFSDKLSRDAMKFSSSLSFDENLIYEDIKVSIAHAEMLAEMKIINDDELKKILSGLTQIMEEYSLNKWEPDETKFEDIHSAIEDKLFQLIGNIAGKLHTGRSRNDQVVTDFRLWIKGRINVLLEQIRELQMAMLSLAEDNITTIMPGYTHLQRAQPVSFAFHLLAYIEMLERDKKRLYFVLTETDSNPLGSGALAGSTLPVDREITTKKLGFSEFSKNALDAVSDRDFVLDFLNACNIGIMHISRLSEELILWSTSEFDFVKISDAYTTGSSLMPQKKNPDMAELSRGKTGRIYGNYISVAVMMKALPLSYNRDMQEDKEPVFDSFENYSHTISIITQIMKNIYINKNRFIKEMTGDFLFATELAEWLVVKGVPFREAHNIVGEIVKYAENKKLKLHQLKLEELKNINSIFDETALRIFDINKALYHKRTYGSPNPDLTKDEIFKWKEKLTKKGE